MSDINALTKRYTEEDSFWNVTVLLNWLIEKKGIPSEIANHALGEVLLELEAGRIIETHHEFDNYVLQKAREHLLYLHNMTTKYLSDKLEAMKKVEVVEKLVEVTVEKIVEVPTPLTGNRWSKMWRALWGKI